MKYVFIVAALVAGLALPAVGAAQGAAKAAASNSLGTVTLSSRVLADGKPLPPGTYQVRLTGEQPKPGAGQSPDAEKYVEFLRGGKVVAREVATVIPAAEIDQVIKSSKPRPNSSKVEKLKGDDYVRVWINRGGNNYLINLPAAPAA
jgi:hypothetical protein